MNNQFKKFTGGQETIGNFFKVQNLNNIKQVSWGVCNAICLDNEGNLFGFGKNCKGQMVK